MDNHNKELAVRLVKDKLGGQKITYGQISERTGYERRQLRRFAEIIESGSDGLAMGPHGNAGKKPKNAASESEIEYLRELKKPYKCITIAQFRDIFLEDVFRNPEKADDVERFSLRPRSASWFRRLFLDEHWDSPCMRDSLENGKQLPHPIRKPMEREGELVQIDGTPFDWLGDGRKWCLHNAIDDATSKVLAGSFMEFECTRGYCNVMKSILDAHGRPKAIYSDRGTVFKNAKSGGDTQFSMMMSDLGIRMIFALSPQAKGRVERSNETAQNRLVNDIIRFGIKDYPELQDWYSSFYIGYLNAKFSFPPSNPVPAYAKLPDGIDLSTIFRGRYHRVLRENCFSYENAIYGCFSEDGEMLVAKDGTSVNLFRDAFTDELYVERYGKRYACVMLRERRKGLAEEAESEKKVDELLRKQRKNN